MEKLQIGPLACTLQRNGESDRLLVLVHGGMDRAESMRRLIRQAGPDANVFAYDRRGYAGSYRPGVAPLLRDHVNDLCALLDFLVEETGIGTESTFLFGHSMGGVISIGASIQRKVAGVAVFESPIAWMPEAARTETGDRMVREVTDPEDYGEGFMRRMVGDKIWERMPTASRIARRAEGLTLLAEMKDVRISTPWHARDVPLPLRIGFGDQSLDHQIANAKLLAKMIPGSSLTQIEGVNHAAHIHAAKALFTDVIRPLWH